VNDYLDQITAFICECTFEKIPADIVFRAKEIVADTIAVMAAGAQEKEVRELAGKLTTNNSNGVATVFGLGIRTESLKASLINGTSGTFLELDEGNQYGRGHAAIQLLPALLAIAEEQKFGGKDLLAAMVIGYEIAIRIGIACKLRMSMHPHGSWGTVGAAVAVGKLLGYGKADMKEIISVSASMTTATNRKTMLEGGTVRNVYSGLSSHNGLLAHYMIQSGFTGESDGLQTVFGSVVSDSFSTEAMVEELGQRYEIGRNYFKQYACCRYNHSALDAVNEIMTEIPAGRLMTDDIKDIKVDTYSLAAQLCGREPGNTLAAKFSIPFAVAARIITGQAGVSSFTPQAVNNEDIRELARKVVVSEDPKLTAMMPDRRPSRVKLTLANGESYQAEAFINKGDAEDPYSTEEIREKYFSLLEPIYGHELAEKLHTQLMRFEAVENINTVTNLLSG
jgi:2-methylcitrate dehydratase PrpD